MVVLTGAAMMVVCSSFANDDVCTVSSAPDLYAKLLSYYEAKSVNNTIYLEPGDYDVSDYDMGYYSGGVKYAADGLSHLSIYRTRLVGKGTDARKVVIYGNRTKRILVNSAGELCNLTISNGCVAAVGGGVWAFHSSVANANASNVVVTCCEATGKNGGGVNGGTWVDCQFVGNEAKNGGGIVGGVCSNCIIRANTAKEVGGGAYYGCALVDCWILSNRAGTNGGGVGATNSKASFCQVVGGVVAGNDAAANGGGACYTDFLGGTVVSNNHAKLGGGIYNSKDSTGGGVRQSATRTFSAIGPTSTEGVSLWIRPCVRWWILSLATIALTARV